MFSSRNQHLQRNLFKGLWLTRYGANPQLYQCKIVHAAYTNLFANLKVFNHTLFQSYGFEDFLKYFGALRI